MEKKLLSVMVADRGAFEKLEAIVEDTDFSEQGKLIYKQIKRMYANDASLNYCDKDLLKLHFQTTNQKHADLFCNVIDQFTDVSIPNLLQFFGAYKKERLSSELAQQLLSPVKGGRIQELIEKYQQCDSITEDKQEENVYHEAGIDELLAIFEPGNVIPIAPKALSTAVGGGVPRGTHLLLYGTPDSGKSLTAINMACGFLRRGLSVLYLGNEDAAKVMLLRFFTRLTGMTRMEIEADRDAATQLATASGYSNLIFKSLSPGSIGDVKRLVERYKPDCLVIDQIHNLRANKDFSKVEKLEALAYEVRNIIKEHNLVGVSVTQAADSAYGKLVLDIDDVYYSNIGVQANVDLMVGIGFDKNYEAMNRRMLSITKSKISSHGQVPVNINPLINKMW